MGDYLRRLDPDLLSDEEKKVNLRGRDQVIASDREHWYALMSRVLIKEEKYDDCMRLCRMALGIFPELHHATTFGFPTASASVSCGWDRSRTPGSGLKSY